MVPATLPPVSGGRGFHAAVGAQQDQV